jgi:hypothetical protein
MILCKSSEIGNSLVYFDKLFDGGPMRNMIGSHLPHLPAPFLGSPGELKKGVFNSFLSRINRETVAVQ